MAGNIKFRTTSGGSVTINASDTASNFNLTVPSTTGSLVIADSATGGLQLPTGTTAQRPTSPVNGMIRLNTSLGQIEYWNGAAWISTSAS